VIGGAFTTISGLPSPYLARLNVDGSLDTSFNATANAPVNSVLVEPSGQLLVGGAFTTIAAKAPPTSQGSGQPGRGLVVHSLD